VQAALGPPVEAAATPCAGDAAAGVPVRQSAEASWRYSTLSQIQLQAAIAAVHDEADRFEDTDWRQILELYELLHSIALGPMVTLNRVVAVAMVHGPQAGLQQLATADIDSALAGHHRVHAARAYLLDMAGDRGQHAPGMPHSGYATRPHPNRFRGLP
jgi:predicted RNA polymerase sigma factor